MESKFNPWLSSHTVQTVPSFAFHRGSSWSVCRKVSQFSQLALSCSLEGRFSFSSITVTGHPLHTHTLLCVAAACLRRLAHRVLLAPLDVLAALAPTSSSPECPALSSHGSDRAPPQPLQQPRKVGFGHVSQERHGRRRRREEPPFSHQSVAALSQKHLLQQQGQVISTDGESALVMPCLVLFLELTRTDSTPPLSLTELQFLFLIVIHKERPKTLVTLETWNQSAKETWPDQPKDDKYKDKDN